jgi:peptidoglycan/LPS O-acetylase OafA/YrhL
MPVEVESTCGTRADKEAVASVFRWQRLDVVKKRPQAIFAIAVLEYAARRIIGGARMTVRQQVGVTDQMGDTREQAPALSSAKSSSDYRPEIDGLRAVAVLAVFIFHLKNGLLRGGFVGVDVFFVISGYLITLILLKEYVRKSFSLGKFYHRRIARLLPAFVAVVIATLIGAFFIYSPQDLASCGANMVAVTLSVANMKFMLQGNYFAISSDAQPLIHFWSLSLEEQFYMLFPAVFLIVYLKARRYTMPILSLLLLGSLVACIILTREKPTWAFFLLPTRAWELLGGSVLANWSASRLPSGRGLWSWVSLMGLMLILSSFFLIKESVQFPGLIAVLPVLGTLCVIGPNNGSGGIASRFLSQSPMVMIGRMSYSLYLWHWPIFSLVDYKLYLGSEWARVGLKLGISFLATVVCFFLIESPGRVFLNQPGRRRLAFGFLLLTVVGLVPLGVWVRNTNYISADMRDVARGGLVFNRGASKGVMVLMGDSNGSMYGTMARQIADECGFKLIVISAAGEDPLPRSSGANPQLWTDSLEIVKQAKPDYVLIACSWEKKLEDDKARIAIAVNELKKYAGSVIIFTQPPALPETATRESMRRGVRPPFVEDPADRAARDAANAMVKSLAGDQVVIIDIDPIFETVGGQISFADASGHQYYHDRGHLSGYGADLVKGNVLKAITSRAARAAR